MPVEVATILRRAAARGEITPDVASIAHNDLLDMRVELFPYAPFASRAWELRDNVASYDAWYVALAEDLGAELATLDVRLAEATGPQCRFRGRRRRPKGRAAERAGLVTSIWEGLEHPGLAHPQGHRQALVLTYRPTAPFAGTPDGRSVSSWPGDATRSGGPAGAGSARSAGGPVTGCLRRGTTQECLVPRCASAAGEGPGSRASTDVGDGQLPFVPPAAAVHAKPRSASRRVPLPARWQPGGARRPVQAAEAGPIARRSSESGEPRATIGGGRVFQAGRAPSCHDGPAGRHDGPTVRA